MTLIVFADKYPQHTFAALSARLTHQSASVRAAAVEGLSALGRRGSEGAVRAVLPCLQDQDVEVRQETVGALRAMAARGDERVTSALVQCLQDPSAQVREAAVE